MRGWLVAVIGLELGLFGCYSPNVPEGAPCNTDNECPSDQACVASACARVGGTAGDRDGDTVPDAMDNCPAVSNRDQHNEDGDKFGDACDPCPQIKDDVGADSDGDGIGDLCDPNPAAQDTLWIFDDFRAIPAWSRSEHWVATADDSLELTATGSVDESLTASISTTAEPDNFRVTTTVKITAFNANQQGDHDAGIEIADVNDPNFLRTVVCYLEHADDGSDSFLLNDNSNASAAIQLDRAADLAIQLDATYRIALERHGTTYTCVLTLPDGNQITLSGASSRVPRNDDLVDVWGIAAKAEFGSLSIVGPPVTAP